MRTSHAQRRRVTTPAKPRTQHEPNNRGVTLTEVLVSLGIMSIGVVSLATLFPLSVLRTVQATQLTQATLLRYSTEGLIEAFPEIVHDPNNNGNVTEHRGEFYVVDPLGYATFDLDNSGMGASQTYGHDDAGTGVTLANRARYGAVFDGTTATAAIVDSANDLASLPDGFADYFDEVPSAADTTSGLWVELASAADLGELQAGDRCVLFDSTGRRSEVRTVDNISGGNRINWLTGLSFVPERVIGQTDDPKFSWLLTVRKSTNGDAAINVAVFFNRKLSRAEEQVYPITGGQTIEVTIVPGSAEPTVKDGGYMLDAENLLWYRIGKVGATVGDKLTLTLAEPLQRATSSAIFPERIVDVYPIGSFSEP